LILIAKRLGTHHFLSFQIELAKEILESLLWQRNTENLQTNRLVYDNLNNIDADRDILLMRLFREPYVIEGRSKGREKQMRCSKTSPRN
jgi:hypothetical protein